MLSRPMTVVRVVCSIALAAASFMVASSPSVAATSTGPASPVANTAAPLVAQVLDTAAELTAPQTLVSTLPARFVETRPGGSTFDGQFEGVGKLTAGTEYKVQIAGRGAVPADAVAVVANVTAVDPVLGGHITIHPCASPRPTASSLNYGANTTIGNELVASLAADGSLCIFVLSSMHVILDVVGYVPQGSDVAPVLPARLLETRAGNTTVDGKFEGVGRAVAGSTTKIKVAGRGGVPPDVDSVIVNVTAVAPVADGFAVVHACLATVPGSSSLNYAAGVHRGNELVVDVDSAGNICVYTSQDLDIMVDVVAYVPPGSTLAPVVPSRLAESRPGLPTVDGVSAGFGKLAGGTEYELQVTGRSGIPSDALAAIVNVTAIDPDGPGFFTVHPCTGPRPLASSLNYTKGVAGGNELIAGLSTTGKLCIYTSTTAHFAVDVVGYLADSAAPMADMSVTKVDDIDPIVAGNRLTYTIAASNAGPATATNVEVTDTFPAGTVIVKTTGCANDRSGVGTCSLGSIAAGATKQYTVTVLVSATTVGSITSSVTVRSDTADPNTGNNTATATTTTVLPAADLSVTMTDDADPVLAGDTVIYTVTVANAGPQAAAGVVATGTLPAGVTFVSTTACAQGATGVPTCSLGSISPGASAEYTVVVTVDAGVARTLTNTVNATSTTSDPNTANNTAVESTVVTPQADLSITKTGDLDEVAPGSNVVYTITVSNAGPEEAAGVVVTDTLPEGVTLVSTTGCVEDPASVLTCTLGSIASGASASFTVTVIVDTGTPAGPMDNNATVTSTAFDLNPANNSVSEPTTVLFQNDAPVFTKGGDQTLLEDAGAQSVAGWASDISSGPADESPQTVSFNVTGNTEPGLFSVGPAVDSSGTLTYTPAANVNGSATITIKAEDDGGVDDGGVDTSASQTFVINVTAVNDVPSFTKGGDETVLEDAGAQSVDGWATAISAGPADESPQTVSFNVTGNTATGLFSVGPAVDSSGTLSYTLAADANGSATITIEAQDDGGVVDGGVDTSASQTFVINVTEVNDVPSFTISPYTYYVPGLQFVPNFVSAFSPGPADESGQTVLFNVTGNTNSGLFSAGPAVDSSGTLTYTTITVDGGTSTITIEAQDNGGIADGGANTSAPQTHVITFFNSGNFR
jgi:uncharacterized repeat protein (TIGR01451 family)